MATLKDPGIVEAELELEVLEVVNIEPWNNTRLSHEQLAWEKSRVGGPASLVEYLTISADPGQTKAANGRQGSKLNLIKSHITLGDFACVLVVGAAAPVGNSVSIGNIAATDYGRGSCSHSHGTQMSMASKGQIAECGQVAGVSGEESITDPKSGSKSTNLKSSPQLSGGSPRKENLQISKKREWTFRGACLSPVPATARTVPRRLN